MSGELLNHSELQVALCKTAEAAEDKEELSRFP